MEKNINKPSTLIGEYWDRMLNRTEAEKTRVRIAAADRILEENARRRQDEAWLEKWETDKRMELIDKVIEENGGWKKMEYDRSNDLIKKAARNAAKKNDKTVSRVEYVYNRMAIMPER